MFFLPLLDYKQLIQKLRHCLAAVMAFPVDSSKTNKFALPNRFFDSLAAGTPVLASTNSIDIRDIVSRNHVGWLLDENEIELSVENFLTDIRSKPNYEKILVNVDHFGKNNDRNLIVKVLDKVFV